MGSEALQAGARRVAARIHLRCAARSTERMRHPIDVALRELRGLSSGGQNMVLRLAELMFDELVGQHLESMADAQTGWPACLHDSVVAHTLSLLHGAPAKRWTSEELAAQAGRSRVRFWRAIGSSPPRKPGLPPW